MSLHLVTDVDFPSRLPTASAPFFLLGLIAVGSMDDPAKRFYGPIPSTISRWLLLSFWPLAVLVASLSWWLN